MTPDPNGLECEVCVENPDAVPGVSNPPDTRAAHYPEPERSDRRGSRCGRTPVRPTVPPPRW